MHTVQSVCSPANNCDKMIQKKSNDINHFYAGGLAGALAALAICPLDVLKTRKQFDSKPNSASVSTVALLKEIAAENGFRGFYAGLASSIAGNLSSFAIYFFTYEKIKKIQHRIIQTHGTFRHTLESIAAAVIAGGISTTVTTPFWVVRAKCMTGVFPQSQPVLSQIVKLYRREGVLAFYHGLVPSFFGLLHVAVQFPAYEYLKTRNFWHKTHSSLDNKATNNLGILTAAIVSKMTASLMTYPHEVVRTRLQTLKGTKYASLRHSIRLIFQEEGFRGFYKGLGTSLVRIIPNTAIMFVAYENFLYFLSK